MKFERDRGSRAAQNQHQRNDFFSSAWHENWLQKRLLRCSELQQTAFFSFVFQFISLWHSCCWRHDKVSLRTSGWTAVVCLGNKNVWDSLLHMTLCEQMCKNIWNSTIFINQQYFLCCAFFCNFLQSYILWQS